MKKLFLILCISFVNLINAQNILNKSKEYHYTVIYKDSNIETNEKMIFKPLGRPWLFQPRKQTAFKIIYFPDTLALYNYKDPDTFYLNRDLKYKKKNKKIRISSNEITGGTDDIDYFFIHPPRRNQYRVLTTAIYPTVLVGVIKEDSIKKYSTTLTTYGKTGKIYEMIYTTNPIKNYIFNNENIGTCWEIKGESFVNKIINSSFISVFSTKYGFISINYSLENNTKIFFQLINVNIKK